MQKTLCGSSGRTQCELAASTRGVAILTVLWRDQDGMNASPLSSEKMAQRRRLPHTRSATEPETGTPSPSLRPC